MRVMHGSSRRPRSAIQAAYEQVRLGRQGELVSPRTLEYSEDRIGQYLHWLVQERPEVRRMGDLDVGMMREYRAFLSDRRTRSGQPLRPKTIAESHTALMTFLRSARGDPPRGSAFQPGAKVPLTGSDPRSMIAVDG
jgi:hypothetical protein